MKIKKTNLTESILLEADEIKTADEVAKENGVTNSSDIDSHDPSSLAGGIAAGVADEFGGDMPVDSEKIEQEGERVNEIVDKYGISIKEPVASPTKVERALARALRTTIREKKSVNSFLKNEGYPNVLIYGLAGFAKTAIVKDFCSRYSIDGEKLNLFECDAKTLAVETVSGIPYPSKDPVTGELKQHPVVSTYWDDLKTPNTILFLDELNRADTGVRGTLLSLINNHELPTLAETDDGKVKTATKYDNILFTVVCLNPASDIFNVQDLDPAEIGRFAAIVEADESPETLWEHLDSVYTVIESLDCLLPQDKACFLGQHDIARKLLNSESFNFDNADNVRDIYNKKVKIYDENNTLAVNPKAKDTLYIPLSYRTFFNVLRNCDGTKNDYLDALDLAHYTPEKTKMIETCLADYKDSDELSKLLFAQPTVKDEKFEKAQQDSGLVVKKSMDDFADSLGTNDNY